MIKVIQAIAVERKVNQLVATTILNFALCTYGVHFKGEMYITCIIYEGGIEKGGGNGMVISHNIS